MPTTTEREGAMHVKNKKVTKAAKVTVVGRLYTVV